MKRFLFLSLALVGGCVLPACDFAKFSADVETDKLKEKVAQLEKEREDAALDAELEEARRQLEIALTALEGEDPDVDGAPDDAGIIEAEPGDAADFTNVPRAVVVEEAPRNGELLPEEEKAVAIEATVPAVLLDTGDHQIFFAELSRFGEWFETRDYGFVWQPSDLQTDSAWRPYTRGRWVNSDQGWTWLSDEPFGWAVYHYGRWVLLAEHGWVWVPGDDWAPAWVSWRQNDDYLGWAPLPPETLYDEVYDYDPGIDLAYDVSPDYYNFVPVDHFYEPVQPHCVPRVTVITIIINTRNVTRFSMRGNHVHCGGPDFAWVNRHARRPGRRCQLDFGGGRDHFAHRQHHRLHEDRLHVFAPRVDAPWNAAVCPSRVAGDLGRVDIVRAGKREIKRDLRHRHHEASVRRHEGAREAIATTECQAALRNNLQRRRTAGEQQEENPLEDRQRRRAKAEESLRAATEAVAAAERRMQDRKLQPEERAEGRRMIEKAGKEVAAVRESLRRRGPTEAPRPVVPGRGTGEKENALAEARRRALAEQKAEEVKRRALVGQKQAEEAKRRALAEQKLSEAKREEMARQRAEEAKRRALAEQKEQKLAEAKREEIARQRAEDAKRRALVEQKAEEVKRRALAQQRAEEAKRREVARQQAEEAKRRALAQQKTEDARRRALAEQRLVEAKRQTVERQQAEDARRQVLARQKVEESRRRAELDARRKAQIDAQRRAEAVRARVEVQRRAELDAQRKAAAGQARRQADAQRAAAEARGRAAARSRAEAQAAARRQKTEAVRREAAKNSRRRKTR
ncbi:MAG: DUF6600 domain-containing protein [Verrucomicrobiota bacterium]|nr:DUF6600 domain-containing protein [Verrucomicrobiota bacterium]